VQVREYDDEAPRIFLGNLELPARPFPKDNRVSQGAIVSHKLLARALTAIQSQQQERDRTTLEERRLTRRERANRERAMEAAWPEEGQSAAPSEPTAVDSILAHALGALARALDLSVAVPSRALASLLAAGQVQVHERPRGCRGRHTHMRHGSVITGRRSSRGPKGGSTQAGRGLGVRGVCSKFGTRSGVRR
jgi:hypothetical protein